MLVKIENNQPITYSVGQLRKAHPNTSFPKKISPETLASYDVYEVVELSRPEYDPLTHKLVQQQVSGSGSTWSRGWDIVVLSQEEITARDEAKAAEVRRERDEKLRDTDWEVVKYLETTGSVPQVLKDYRQSLRDLPGQQEFPSNPVWPSRPNL